MTGRIDRRAALAALVACVVAPVARAQDPRASEAQNAARQWLAIADRFDADASYTAAGSKFRDALNRDGWREAMAKVRQPLGKVEQRTVLGTQFVTAIPGQPNGDYALIGFRTAWEKKTIGRELVSLEREGGRWRVVGYVVQ